MNHKPRTRLAALLLACLLLCPSPGRSEAAVQTDVPVPQEAAIPAEETVEPQETVQEPAATPAEEAAQEVKPTEAPALPTQEPMPEPNEAPPETALQTQPPAQAPTEVPQPPTEEPTSVPEAEAPSPAPETVPAQTGEPLPLSLQDAMAQRGYAYVLAAAIPLYAAQDLAEPAYCMTQETAVLLVHRFAPEEGFAEVWLLNESYELTTAYTAVDALPEAALSDQEVAALAGERPSALTADERLVFVVPGYVPAQEPVPEPGAAETVTPSAEPEAAETPSVQPGAFVQVSTQTNVYTGIDSSGMDADSLWAGCFTQDATVQVEETLQDALGRWWYRVRYLYGDDFADGTLKWTEQGTLWVLEQETCITGASGLTVTDYALPVSTSSRMMRMSASPMPGFSLKTINAPVPSLYVGQGGLHGSSGKDSAYLQIAKAPDHGTVYATPHYLDGYTVYCLEHTLPGPGENISGGGQQPTGPYVIVDMDSYRTNPGYSSIIYHESTLHAIGWVLRHTYPFMVIDDDDPDNETWSRVAGQFAIRQVIRELEGPQYVRDYWNMDNFYRASGQAPGVYLEYARWLAANGIARASMTGAISVSNQSTRFSGGSLTGTVTLTTDADLIRVSRSYGALTGNTAGQDESYYYLNSGDTVSITAPGTHLSFVAESVSSDEEEASFLVGVPDVAIQKVLIPQYGAPYKLQSVTVTFDMPLGAAAVTKTSASTGAPLAGAVFELVSGDAVIATQTTGADGVARFENLQPGVYTIREKSAPEGYLVSVPGEQSVTVTAGGTAHASFANAEITGKICVVKRDSLTREALAGAEFTVTRLSAPAGATGVGDSVVIVTDASGVAETGWLPWGRYRIEETTVPQHYVDVGFETEVEIRDSGRTCEIEVENEPTKGYIRITKTDRLNGNPIEGVRFDIYENDEYGSALASSMVTDENGVAVSELLRKGRYIVREHGETAGYVFEEIALDAVVKPDETTDLSVTNQPVRVRLKLYKRDADEYAGKPADAPGTRGDGELTGAVFRVLAAQGITDRQGNVIYEKGAVVVDSLTTAGEDASVTTDALWPGVYEIVELAPPVGYQAAVDSIIVDARAAAKQSQEAVVIYEGVVTNEIRYGAQAIVKLLGGMSDDPDPDRVETPEAGAEFLVYLRKAGSYENARALERDRLVTDENGYAKTKALPYGVYVLEQTKGAPGYELKGPILFEIDGTEDILNPPPLTLSDRPIRYRLRLIKTDSETGKAVTLSGVSFKLRDETGEFVTQTVSYPTRQETDTFVTDETGSVTLPETLTWGLYFVEEVTAPKGYLIREEALPVFVGQDGDAPGETYQIDVEVPNKPVKGRILLEKKGPRLTGLEVTADAYGNEAHRPVYEERYLAGAVFELRAAETVTGGDGTVWFEQGELVETLTTASDGPAASGLLPLGRYVLVEIHAPEGYALDDTPHEVTLDASDAYTPVVEVRAELTNEYLPAEITLTKYKETMQAMEDEHGVRQTVITVPGEGFVFGLYNASDIPYDGGVLPAGTLVASGATDTEGRLVFAGQYPHGEYYVKELQAPEGWKLSAGTFPVSILPEKAQEDAVIRAGLTVHNELICTPVTITKTDITGAAPVPGALIEVRNSRDEIIYRARTDENGELPDILLMPGQYAFREVLAPDGYALNEAVCIFVVDAQGQVSGDTEIRDDWTRFSLRKTDTGGRVLAGVQFALVDADGNQIMTAETDENGLASFERIPYGRYTVVETQPLPGYLPAGTVAELTVDGQYVNPDAPLEIVNVPADTPDIQTGVDLPFTPLMWAGVGMTAGALALIGVYGYRRRKRR